MKFIKKVQDSELDLVGRALVFIAGCTIVFFMNHLIAPGTLKPTVFLPIQLFVTFIFCVMGLFCAAMAYIAIFIVIGAIGWVFTGEFKDGILDATNDVLTYTVVLLFMFLFGDWNRKWIKGKKNEPERKDAD